MFCSRTNNISSFTCITCNKVFKSSQSKRKFCSWKCVNRYLDNNPNWRGGKSFEPYPLGWNKTYKEQIRYRDKYKCQICSKPEIENNRKLEVHHKDYNKKNIKLDNLITLCKSCHSKTNFNREYWINFFNRRLYEVHQ